MAIADYFFAQRTFHVFVLSLNQAVLLFHYFVLVIQTFLIISDSKTYKLNCMCHFVQVRTIYVRGGQRVVLNCLRQRKYSLTNRLNRLMVLESMFLRGLYLFFAHLSWCSGLLQDRPWLLRVRNAHLFEKCIQVFSIAWNRRRSLRSTNFSIAILLSLLFRQILVRCSKQMTV